MTTYIRIPVREEAAAVYERLDDAQKRTVQESVEQALQRVEQQSAAEGQLRAIMNRLSDEARARGLTPEILAEILADDGE